MENTYWNHNGKYQALADAIEKLIPDEGDCPADKPLLEKFRKAANCYYDFYNNGLCNRASEFRAVFGFSGRIDGVEAKMEAKMNQIVLLAASENLA